MARRDKDTARGWEGFQCTYGYNARSVVNATRYLITAGHCENERWVHDGYSIGSTDFNNLASSGSSLGDFQRVPTFLSPPMNLVYVTDSERGRTIDSIRTYRNQLEGDHVCLSSVVNGYRCGPIVEDDFYYGIDFRGRTVWMWGKLAGSAAQPVRSDPGDSGGPAFFGWTAYGIISARDGNSRTAYGAIDLAMEALNARLCLTGTC